MSLLKFCAFVSDLEKVATGIGDKLALIIQALGTFFGGLVIGFVYVWQLALLMIGCAPVIMLLAGLVQRVRSLNALIIVYVIFNLSCR